MFCTSCGKELNAESKFCTSCGRETAVTKKTEGLTENKPLWKKILGGVAGVLAFFVAYGVAKYAVQEIFTASSSDSSETVEQVLVEASNETNKQLPMMVDSVTQLSATMATGKVFIYSYKLIGADYISVTQADLTSALGGDITKAACTTPETKPMLDMGVKLVYRYSNEEGSYLGEIPVTLANCNN